MNRVSFLW